MSLKFCTNCGHELSDGECVCPNCGAKVISDDYSIDEQLELLKDEPVVVEEKVVEEVVVEEKVTKTEKDDKKKAKEEAKRKRKQEKEDKKEKRRQEKEDKKNKRRQEKEDKKNKHKVEKENKKNEPKEKVVEEKKVEEKPKKVKEVRNLESGVVKTLKVVLGIVSILALLGCSALAIVLTFECELTNSSINYLEFIGENFKLLDGAKLSVNLVSLLIFNVVLPLCFIITLFVKQLFISLKIFTVGKNKNRKVLWEVLADCLISIFVIMLISNSLSQTYKVDNNPLFLLIVPVCFNLIFYTTLYFVKLFRGEIGEFKLGSASTKGLFAHRLIQSINIILVIIVCSVSTTLLIDGVTLSFKPFSGIRGFIGDNLTNYGMMNEIIPAKSIFNLLSVVLLFGSNLVVMILEVTLIIGLINSIYRFIVRDSLEEYYNKCFYKTIKNKLLVGLILVVIFKMLYFVVTYIYLTTKTESIVDISFVSCLSYVAPYLIGAFITFVLGLINSLFAKKWLHLVKENSED